MTSTTTTPVVPTRQPNVTARIVILSVVAVAVVVAMALTAWTRSADAPASTGDTAPTGVSVFRHSDTGAYAPGGSVYEQQVPAGVDPAFAPGGSVYDQQVPAGIDAPAAYAPGGSVYDEQVPTGGSGSGALSPYAPGGSVYDEQVPGN